MKYQTGKSFQSNIVGKAKSLPPIDYIIPTEYENQKYLNLMGRQVLSTFEKEVEERRKQREQDKIDFS